MKWVSVKERLPKDDENVLVWNQKVPMSILVCYYDLDWNEFICYQYGMNLPISVTHWMPYPRYPGMEID